MIVIHGTALVAVHEQLVPEVTETALVLPIEVTDTLVGVTVELQLEAACVNVTIWPETVSVPVRAAVVVFASTV